MNVSRPLRILRYGVDASRPSMRLKVALGLTTHLTSKGVVASGLSCNVNTLLLLRMADRGIAVIVGGVDIAIPGVRHSDNTILDVDIAILGVDMAFPGVDIAILGFGVDIAILRVQKRKHKKNGGGYEGWEEGWLAV